MVGACLIEFSFLMMFSKYGNQYFGILGSSNDDGLLMR